MGDLTAYLNENLHIWREHNCAHIERLAVCNFVSEPKETIQLRLDRYSRAWEILFDYLKKDLLTTPYVTQEWLDGIWSEKLDLPRYDKF